MKQSIFKSSSFIIGSVSVLFTQEVYALTAAPSPDVWTALQSAYMRDSNVQQIFFTFLAVAVFLAILLAVTSILALLYVSIFVEPKHFSRGEALQTAWLHTKKYLWFFIGLMIIQFILTNLPGFLFAKLFGSQYLTSGALQNFSRVLQFALILYTQAGMVVITLKLLNGQKTQFKDFFVGPSTYIKYAAAGILHILATIGGLFLLVIPGLAWFTRFFFWPYYIIDKGVGPIEALKQSARITAGKRKDVFLLTVYLTGVILLGMLALLVGLFIATPLVALATAHVYRQLLSQIQEEGVIVPKVQSPTNKVTPKTKPI